MPSYLNAVERNDQQFRRELDALRREVGRLNTRAETQAAAISNLVAGSHMTPALTSAADMVLVQIYTWVHTLAVGWAAVGKRIIASPDGFAEYGYIEDPEDDAWYIVEPTPWCNAVFKGARVMAVYDRPAREGEFPEDWGTTVYRMVAGEPSGFAAVLDTSDEPEREEFNGKNIFCYPWRQIGLPVAAAHTHETEFEGFTYGKAVAIGDLGADYGAYYRSCFATHTVVRMYRPDGDLDVNTVNKFVFSAGTDLEYVTECP